MLSFDKNTHTYLVDGQRFDRSVTQVVSDYMPDFPKEIISKAIGKRDGIDPQEVVDKWDLNGQISTYYGNAIHKSVEYWLRYGVKANQMGWVVDKFEEIWQPKGSITPEISVYSTELSVCGTMDMFEDLGEKRAIIHDIKTGDIYKQNKKKMRAPFNDLEATPYNKYRLQLSIYKDLLERLGWEVEALKIWWWNDQEWTVLELEAVNTKDIWQT